jgi:hypothetical protein
LAPVLLERVFLEAVWCDVSSQQRKTLM